MSGCSRSNIRVNQVLSHKLLFLSPDVNYSEGRDEIELLLLFEDESDMDI